MIISHTVEPNEQYRYTKYEIYSILVMIKRGVVR